MKTIWNDITNNEKEDIFDFCSGYRDFLDLGKTERECEVYFEEEAGEHGFVNFDEVVAGKIAAVPGLKVFKNIRNKSFIAAILGKDDIEKGARIIGSHIDSPRLDFKPRPYFENAGLGYIKTHYYGGIKKYQWVTVPLSIHGVAFKTDGTKVTFSIGENEDDPVFYISDLLPHLSQEQNDKTAAKAIPAENLNIIAGSMTEKDEENKDSVKAYIYKYLSDNYGLTEKELMAAEIEAVPAFKAKDVGFDRSFIASYAHDDRVCAYTSFNALIDIEDIPEKTCVCYCSDKEEIGSVGNTGAQSSAFVNFMGELVNIYHSDSAYISLRRCLENSKLLSADVTAAFDPTYSDAYDKYNASYSGMGVALEKYTGARGKSDASDANAEYLSEITNVFTKNNIPWQVGEMGRTDLGGGGTIAKYMANLGMDVVDCGVPLFSMHAPYELASKADIFWTYKAYNSFFTYNC